MPHRAFETGVRRERGETRRIPPRGSAPSINRADVRGPCASSTGQLEGRGPPSGLILEPRSARNSPPYRSPRAETRRRAGQSGPNEAIVDFSPTFFSLLLRLSACLPSPPLPPSLPFAVLRPPFPLSPAPGPSPEDFH